ncbi:ABC-three component system middle component 6 [Pseudarthrobacter sp. MM222]|uniref:ABC-three component system middle component 6 n=1 Tax=Pseudarthrobacter sp. MM222 TaxID=3018929 RepID=UPI003FA781B0
MILPTKGISPQRALVTVGAQALEVLTLPRSSNSAFEATKQLRLARGFREPLSFDWFSLALALLYSIGAIGLSNDGLLVRTTDADH